ncbi:MAG: dTMP kinase [Candidatus Parvarchaeota archaeon]|jgi:dTMP kinase|nr:dTMP kinase [Candidatus Parvarchaeota archaeon]
MKGRLIILEGLDGSGLFTQATLLAQHLKRSGIKVFLTKEPTNSVIGKLIKASLSGKFTVSAKTLQLLFSADRSHHLNMEIEPALNRGETVICDRYIFSTIAYGFVSKVNYKWLRTINLNFRLPDIGIFLDVTPETALNRVFGKESHLQLFDDKNRLNNVRQMYLQLAREFHLKKIDGNDDIEHVSEKINLLVDKLIKK